MTHHDGLRLRSSGLEEAGDIGSTSRRKGKDRFCRGLATAGWAAAPPVALRRRGGGVQASHATAIYAIGMLFVLATGRSAAARSPEPMSRRASSRASAKGDVPMCRSFVNVSTFVSLQNAVVDGACIDVLADISFPTTLEVENGVSVKLASSANATLDGGWSTNFFIIRLGNLYLGSITMVHGYYRYGGSAVYVNPPGHLEATNCRFVSNAACLGGVLHSVGISDLSHCIFRNNVHARWCPDIRAQGTAVSLLGPFEASHCTFVDNTALAGGGAVTVGTGANCVVTSCLFRSNGSPSGGALFCYSATSVFCSTFEDNWTLGLDGSGSAIYAHSSTLQLSNTSISSSESSTACVIDSKNSDAGAVALFYMTEAQWMTDGKICAFAAPLIYNSKLTPYLIFAKQFATFELDDIPRCGDADIGDFCDPAYCTNEPPGFLGIQCYCPVDGKQVDPMLGACVSQPHTFAPSSPVSPFPSPFTTTTNGTATTRLAPTQQPGRAGTPKEYPNDTRDTRNTLFAGALASFSLLVFCCIVACFYRRRGRGAAEDRAQSFELDTFDGGSQMTQESLLEAPSSVSPTSQLAYLEDSPGPVFVVDRKMRIVLWSSGK
jgi:hypothetical protein